MLAATVVWPGDGGAEILHRERRVKWPNYRPAWSLMAGLAPALLLLSSLRPSLITGCY